MQENTGANEKRNKGKKLAKHPEEKSFFHWVSSGVMVLLMSDCARM
jgi:hypothetical protein